MSTPAVPLYRLLEDAADAYGDRPALVYRGATLTFERVREQMNRLASSLQQALAVDPGHHVAVHLPNMPQSLIAAHALWKLGAVLVPIDPAVGATQIARQVAQANARVIVTLSALYPTVMAAQPETPLRHVLVAFVKDYLPLMAKIRYALFREKREGQSLSLREAPRFVYPYTNMVLHNPRPDPVDVNVDDPALLLADRTHTHRDLLAAIGPGLAESSSRSLAITVPFWQWDGLVAALAALYRGDCLLLESA